MIIMVYEGSCSILTYSVKTKLKAICIAFVIAGIFSIVYNFVIIYEMQIQAINQLPKVDRGEIRPLIVINFWQPYVLAGIAFLGIGIVIFAVMVFRILETETKSRL